MSGSGAAHHQHLRSQTLTGPMSGEADPSRIMRALQDTYLIRGDTMGARTWYELTHDRLIEPVLQSNREWRSALLSQERGEPKRTRRALGLLVLAAFVELIVILILIFVLPDI